jgi:CheY-like chemotaxis protein
MMPNMSGIDLFEEVRARKPGLESRFVFLSGGVFDLHAAEFLATLPNALLTKPVRADELLRAIDDAASCR